MHTKRFHLRQSFTNTNLIAKEMSNEEIANNLFISERTVEAHRRNIFTKTNTKSIVGLIKYAIKNDLIDNKT